MTDKLLDLYLDLIKDDLITLRNANFTGNIEFKVNFKEGGIANMNCGKHRSVRFNEDDISQYRKVSFK